jgi:hypothetical protein
MTTTKPADKTTAPTATPSKPATKPAASPKKTVARPAAKSTAKPATKAVAKPASKSVVKAAPAKPAKPKKPKMVRDSFTFPKLEYAVLDTLKLRAAKLGKPVKKTELLRAGLKAIAAMSDSALLAALQAVPSLKTGRPAKA